MQISVSDTIAPKASELDCALDPSQAPHVPPHEHRRFRRHFANDPQARLHFPGRRMATVSEALEITYTARRYDNEVASEDEWNTDIHARALDLALRTSGRQPSISTLSVYVFFIIVIVFATRFQVPLPCSVQLTYHLNSRNCRIEPRNLSPSPALPSRIIDYVYALQSDDVIERAWIALPPTPGGGAVRSWNHTCSSRARTRPFAVHIETKTQSKSWTDGLPQLGIWTSAFLERLRRLPRTCPGQPASDRASRPPAVPVVVVQGHEWHFVVISKRGERTTIWQMINIGSTRNLFDFMKIMSALHKLLDWAEDTWRPWLHSLL